MKFQFKQAACAILCSLIISTAARTEDGPGFLLVNATVTDFNKLGVYGQALPDVYAKYEGEYVIFGGIGRNVEVFAGTAKHQSLIFARFDDKATVEKFWWSDDYRAVVPLREGAGQFDVVGFQGTGETPYEPIGNVQPAYVFTYIKIKDREKMLTYMEQTQDLTMNSPGRVIALARPDDVALLEGPSPEFTIEISSWPSVKSYKDFMSRPDYQAAIPNRDEAMDLVVLIAETPRQGD